MVLGTAGHIDHGKTALVRALTGVDTDRLPEEHARGISIELGYAALDLPSGRRLSVVDVPGHERFVRTMVAGATGIDLYLMTVAADDGVMPQTREHAAVLAALGVSSGVVAVTKSDVASPERAAEEARELLPGAPVVAVSARTGAGLEDLRGALDALAPAAPAREAPKRGVRLHVDRVFTIHGAGTVVTGTLWSGTVARGDEVLVLPRGVRARVRAVQVHDDAVDSAAAGRRVALNLAGVGRDELARGDVVVTGDAPAATYRVEARLDLAPDPPRRVAVHHGTRESPARLVPRDDGRFQLRLESPLVCDPGDRVVIRSIAPPDTLGGGTITDTHPPRVSPKGSDPSGDTIVSALTEASPKGSDPLSPAPLSELAVEVEERLRAAGFEPPLDGELDAGALAELRAHGRAVRVARNMHLHVEALGALRERLVEMLRRDGSLTLADFRDELQTSRKYAQAFLEHFDAERVTLRVGDERRLRSRWR